MTERHIPSPGTSTAKENGSAGTVRYLIISLLLKIQLKK